MIQLIPKKIYHSDVVTDIIYETDLDYDIEIKELFDMIEITAYPTDPCHNLYAPLILFTPTSGTIQYEWKEIPASHAKEYGKWAQKTAILAEYMIDHKQELLEAFHKQKEQESQIEKE